MAQTRTEIDVHLIWATSGRAQMPAHALARVHGLIAAKAKSLGCPHVVVGGIADHVHVLARVPPALALARLVQALKGASSYFMNTEICPESCFRWQCGYAAFSVGTAELAAVATYIRNQPQHHAALTTTAALECNDLDE